MLLSMVLEKNCDSSSTIWFNCRNETLKEHSSDKKTSSQPISSVVPHPTLEMHCTAGGKGSYEFITNFWMKFLKWKCAFLRRLWSSSEVSHIRSSRAQAQQGCVELGPVWEGEVTLSSSDNLDFMHKRPSEIRTEQKDVEEGEEGRALPNLNWPSKGFCPHESSLMVLCRGDAELWDARFDLFPLLKISSSRPLEHTPGVVKWRGTHLDL